VYAGVGQIAAYVSALKREGLSFSLMVEMGPLETRDYQILGELGIKQVLLFQETYDRGIYAEVHSGRKGDYDWRLTALTRARGAGIEQVGFGILLGLHDYRKDLMSLIRHAWYFKEKLGVFPATFSFPRLRPAHGIDAFPITNASVSDDDYEKIIAMTRLALPSTGIVLTTREAPDFRDQLLKKRIGITHISAGSSTAPGGYTVDENNENGQFNIFDRRSLSEVIETVRKLEYQPCMAF
jgi:2-iminoacetate synthase